MIIAGVLKYKSCLKPGVQNSSTVDSMNHQKLPFYHQGIYLSLQCSISFVPVSSPILARSATAR